MMVGGWDKHCALRALYQASGKKAKILVSQQGPVRADFGTSGLVASIRLKIENSWYASRAYRCRNGALGSMRMFVCPRSAHEKAARAARHTITRNHSVTDDALALAHEPL